MTFEVLLIVASGATGVWLLQKFWIMDRARERRGESGRGWAWLPFLLGCGALYICLALISGLPAVR